jgi:hypothetical protein
VSPTELALARIRQLAAHEVGHTLGLDHNFAASTYGRASVMDYPAPLVQIKGGRLDLSDAYGRGIGAFDAFTIRFGYSQFAPGTDEDAALAGIVREGVQAGMLFVSDEHSRDPGTPHPLGAVWDNGADPSSPCATRSRCGASRSTTSAFPTCGRAAPLRAGTAAPASLPPSPIPARRPR